MKIRLGNETLILFVILSGAFAIRFLFWRFGYLYGADPYFHYGNYKELVDLGHLIFPLGLYSIPLFFKTIFGLFGISEYDTFRITAPIIGIMTIFVTYFLAREVFGKKAALYSAIILSLTPVFILRTMAGNFRGDPFSMFFAVLCFFLFLVSIKYNKDTKKAYLLAISGGISLAFSAFVWSSGFIFAALVISGSMIVIALGAFVRGDDNRENILKYFIFAGSSILIVFTFSSIGILHKPITSISGFSDFSKLIFPGAILLLGSLELGRTRLSSLGSNKRLFLALGAGVFFFVVLIVSKPELLEKFVNLYKPRYGSGSLQTVEELRPITLDLIYYLLNIIPAIAIIGLVSQLWKKRVSQSHIFLIVWLMAGTYVMIKIGSRGSFIASIPFAIFAGYGIDKVHEFIIKLDIPWRLKRFKFQNLVTGFILIYIASMGIFVTINLEPRINDKWYDALTWEKENLPEDSVVLSWWDYGYWISTIGGGKPIINPGQDPKKVREVADIFFEEDEKEVQRFLAKYQVDYILMPSDIIFQVTNIHTIRGIDERTISNSNIRYRLLLYYATEKINGIEYDNYHGLLFINSKSPKGMEGFVRQNGIYPAHLYYQKVGMIFENTVPPGQGYPLGSFFISNNDMYLSNFNISSFAYFIPAPLEKNFLTSLLFLNGKNFEGTVKLIYLNPQIKIYKANYDNIEK